MRILLVSHRYPPAHRAGTELYSARLAAGLRAKGHDVRVVCAEKEISVTDLTVREREHEGVRVTEIVNNLQYSEFRETWDYPALSVRFAEVLDGFEREGWQPDVCHFQHFMYLGVSCVEACAARGYPVVLTLHDYWLQCARMGQRRHADESLCEVLEPERCGGCLVDFKWRQSSLESRVGSALAGLRRATGVDLGPLATGATRALSKAGDAERNTAAFEALPEAKLLAQEVETRSQELRERLGAAVTIFTSPSAFLRERFVEWGIPKTKVLHLPTGIDFTSAATARQAAKVPLDVLFLGSYIPAKGAHVLLEAWGRIAPGLGANGRLQLHGPEHAPEYARGLREKAAQLSGVDVGGMLDSAAVPARLAQADLLVVPSLWWENAPLVILEAAKAGTPVLASDAGAMRDFVREGENGLRFPLGDAVALARSLESLLREPQRIDALRPEALAVPSVQEWSDSFDLLYESLVETAEPK